MIPGMFHCWGGTLTCILHERKVFTLQTLYNYHPFADTVGNVAGFSLQAGVAAKTHE